MIGPDVQHQTVVEIISERLVSIGEAVPQVINCWQAADDPLQT